tara:strand:- start:286 stop:558 length:273 start_codon:yes stop_codon:yes gene_type:complete
MNCVSETPATKNNNSFYSMLNTNKSKKLYGISDTIEIPKNFDKSSNEYSLTTKFFDPNQSSPPNEWNNRLMKRIDDYFADDKILCSRCMK